jgi:hypothetical protein
MTDSRPNTNKITTPYTINYSACLPLYGGNGYMSITDWTTQTGVALTTRQASFNVPCLNRRKAIIYDESFGIFG